MVISIQIYASELDYYVNDSILCSNFKQRYPSTLSAKVMLDSVTKASKGYGFVKFGSFEESQRALKEM